MHEGRKKKQKHNNWYKQIKTTAMNQGYAMCHKATILTITKG